mmetsp:Transcript_9171/g.27253  ORF Transcript_9171/g.27253 Transcript_9171/m.27253 type:complete len:380 (+) Transcript_9171:267-1406(+)
MLVARLDHSCGAGGPQGSVQRSQLRRGEPASRAGDGDEGVARAAERAGKGCVPHAWQEHLDRLDRLQRASSLGAAEEVGAPQFGAACVLARQGGEGGRTRAQHGGLRPVDAQGEPEEGQELGLREGRRQRVDQRRGRGGVRGGVRGGRRSRRAEQSEHRAPAAHAHGGVGGRVRAVLGHRPQQQAEAAALLQLPHRRRMREQSAEGGARGSLQPRRGSARRAEPVHRADACSGGAGGGEGLTESGRAAGEGVHGTAASELQPECARVVEHARHDEAGRGEGKVRRDAGGLARGGGQSGDRGGRGGDQRGGRRVRLWRMSWTCHGRVAERSRKGLDLTARAPSRRRGAAARRTARAPLAPRRAMAGSLREGPGGGAGKAT